MFIIYVPQRLAWTVPVNFYILLQHENVHFSNENVPTISDTTYVTV